MALIFSVRLQGLVIFIVQNASGTKWRVGECNKNGRIFACSVRNICQYGILIQSQAQLMMFIKWANRAESKIFSNNKKMHIFSGRAAFPIPMVFHVYDFQLLFPSTVGIRTAFWMKCWGILFVKQCRVGKVNIREINDLNNSTERERLREKDIYRKRRIDRRAQCLIFWWKKNLSLCGKCLTCMWIFGATNEEEFLCVKTCDYSIAQELYKHYLCHWKDACFSSTRHICFALPNAINIACTLHNQRISIPPHTHTQRLQTQFTN